MARLPLEEAYPGIAFRPRTRNWWARLTRVPAECVHLEWEPDWMATLIPDTLYLRGKPSHRRRMRRPEVSLCRECLTGVLEAELAAYVGRAVAFEPDGESVSQYFYVAAPDFKAAGLEPSVSDAIEQRLAGLQGACETCGAVAGWLWFTRTDVSSLDDVARISAAPGHRYCARHGAQALCRALAALSEANLFYVNVPYGEAGAYVWI